MVEKVAAEARPKYESVARNIDAGIALFGAGTFGALCYDFLKEKKYNISCFIDNAKEKQGTEFCGLKVEASHPFHEGVILITNQTYSDVIKQSIGGGGGRIMTVNAFFSIKNIEKFKSVRDNVFMDAKSKTTLDTLVYEHITSSNKAWQDIYDKNQYFCLAEFGCKPGEVYVDIGASVGDSIERFIWKNYGLFSKIYGFEPSPREYAALKNRKKRLEQEWALDENQITAVNVGIAEKTQMLSMKVGGLHASSFVSVSADTDASANDTMTYSIDEYFKNTAVTFIKADVEGFEMRCLRGASAVIKRDKPKIAFCVYHKPEDIFDFVEYISALVPEYKFKLRHHSQIWHETVLYAFV
jgi:FkbM family methyltransferase